MKIVQVAKKEAKCVTQEKRAKDLTFKKLLNNKNVKVVGAKLHTIFLKIVLSIRKAIGCHIVVMFFNDVETTRRLL